MELKDFANFKGLLFGKPSVPQKNARKSVFKCGHLSEPLGLNRAKKEGEQGIGTRLRSNNRVNRNKKMSLSSEDSKLKRAHTLDSEKRPSLLRNTHIQKNERTSGGTSRDEQEKTQRSCNINKASKFLSRNNTLLETSRTDKPNEMRENLPSQRNNSKRKIKESKECTDDISSNLMNMSIEEGKGQVQTMEDREEAIIQVNEDENYTKAGVPKCIKERAKNETKEDRFNREAKQDKTKEIMKEGERRGVKVEDERGEIDEEDDSRQIKSNKEIGGISQDEEKREAILEESLAMQRKLGLLDQLDIENFNEIDQMDQRQEQWLYQLSRKFFLTELRRKLSELRMQDSLEEWEKKREQAKLYNEYNFFTSQLPDDDVSICSGCEEEDLGEDCDLLEEKQQEKQSDQAQKAYRMLQRIHSHSSLRQLLQRASSSRATIREKDRDRLSTKLPRKSPILTSLLEETICPITSEVKKRASSMEKSIVPSLPYLHRNPFL